MRPFSLKKTITHATVLSELFPSVAALSQQLPVGFYGKITTVSAGAAAILGHELVPAGTTLQDPAKAPSRGGYVYDSFNSVVRSGVTRECVKHGLWSLEAATPDCEPWLFAAPAPAPEPKAAVAPAPAPKAAPPAPAPAPAASKDEGFPEWMGPEEAALGIVQLWAEDGIEPEDAAGELDLIGASLVYFHDWDDTDTGDDRIGAPISHDDNDGMDHLSANQWPADPHASGDQEPEAASNDHWVPAPEEEKAEEPGHSMLEEQWPGEHHAGQDDDAQSWEQEDTSWLIPNPLPEGPADEMIGRYEEDSKEPDDAIVGHSIYHEDGSSGAAAVEDDISFPKHYAEEEVSEEPEPEQMAVAPYKSPYDYHPFAEAADDDEEEQQPYSADYSKVPTAKMEPAPAKPPAKPAPAAEEEHLMTVVLSADALFDFDRYVLRPAGKNSLDDFVAALQDVKWGQILVVGHSDRLGSAKYNLRLSERRTQAVRKQLIAKGLDGKKIKAEGKGKAQPVSSGCVGTKRTKELIACLQPDRRVEIFVDEKREVKITKPVKPKK